MAVTPAVTATLVKKGFTVNVESKAGFEAKFRDTDYTSVGGNIVDAKKAFDSGIILDNYLNTLSLTLTFYSFLYRYSLESPSTT